MPLIVTVLVGILVMSCSSVSRNEVTVIGDPIIRLEDGFYIKEYALGQESDSYTRYVYVQCDSNGNLIRGLAGNSMSGYRGISVGGTVLTPEDADYAAYQKLKEKYGTENEYELYLVLKKKFETQ